MSLNNAVVNSFLPNDADLLFVLKTKAMKKLIKHFTPDEKYAFIERVVDGLPGAVIESDILTYNMNGDQVLFVDVTYTPKGGRGDVRARVDLDNVPSVLFSLDNPRKEVGYRLLSYFLALRDANNKLTDAFTYIQESGNKVKKVDKRARSLIRKLCWFIYLSLLDIVTSDAEEAALNGFLGIGCGEEPSGTDEDALLSRIVDISAMACELTEGMLDNGKHLAYAFLVGETTTPFVVSRSGGIEAGADILSGEYRAKTEKFIQNYHEYLTHHNDKDASDKVRRVICGLYLAYGVVEALRYPFTGKSEMAKLSHETLTNWSVLAKRLYNVIDQF
jgi:hypothetical protein|nr:MAG TPA: hypothetical protein [Caudoviricetes sp.]